MGLIELVFAAVTLPEHRVRQSDLCEVHSRLPGGRRLSDERARGRETTSRELYDRFADETVGMERRLTELDRPPQSLVGAFVRRVEVPDHDVGLGEIFEERDRELVSRERHRPEHDLVLQLR